MISYAEYSKIRDSKGLKDGKVAELANIGRSTFSDWKSGRSNPKEEKLRKIAAALGISYASMMGWEQLPLSTDDFPDKSTIALENIMSINKENGGSSKFAEFLYDTTVKKATRSNITDNELSIIDSYRLADDTTKDMIVRLLAFAVEQENKK